jgi:hypothetical protein
VSKIRGAGLPSALRVALTPFVAAKLIAFLVPVLVVWSTSNAAGHPSFTDFTQTFGYWDGVTYIDIAQHGYPAGPLDLIPGHPGHVWGFYPGLPILLRAGAFVVHDFTVAGIVINSLGELVALYFLARLVLLEREGDEGAAGFACWLLALYPDAVFLSAVYTDSVFLAAAMATLYYMRRGQIGGACVTAGIAVGMRITGLVLIPVLLVEYLRRRRGRVGFDVVAIGASLTPVLLFCVYAWRQTGDFLAYKTAQQSASYGDKQITWPWNGFLRTLDIARGGGPASYNFFFISDVAWGVAGFIALGYLAVRWRRYPPSLTLFAASVWLLSACSTYWQGLMRYEMAFVPIFLAGADLYRRRPQLATGLLAVSGAWMVFQTATFATGRFIV